MFITAVLAPALCGVKVTENEVELSGFILVVEGFVLLNSLACVPVMVISLMFKMVPPLFVIVIVCDADGLFMKALPKFIELGSIEISGGAGIVVNV